jgi:glycosyltransferase involved in cell wall biosynthesis
VNSGAPIRTYNVLRRFAETSDVYLAAFWSTEEQKNGIAHLREFCREVVAVRYKPLKERLRISKVLGALLRGEPPELRVAYSDEFADKIRQLTNRVEFDIVQIEHGMMGLYLEALPTRLRKRAVWMLSDIDFIKYQRIARIERSRFARTRARFHAAMLRRWQPRLARSFGLCLTMTEVDRDLILAADSSLRVEVSVSGVDTSQFRPVADESDNAELLFVGNMRYEPNVDAMVYFCREVLPVIRRQVADATLRIVGINPGQSVKELEGNGVIVTGGVPDVVPYYKGARVCVVPLRAGSGIRAKITEAMALGRPVVSTSLGCEGLNVTDGQDILIADDSMAFAEQTVRLLKDSALRARIAANARQKVMALYDWDVIAAQLLKRFETLARQ